MAPFPLRSRKIAFSVIIVFEAILITIFGFLVDYGPPASPIFSNLNSSLNDDLVMQYPLFQDIHVMVFIGFGFLMTFLRKYAYSALGFTFLLSCIVIQWGIICSGLMKIGSGEAFDIPIDVNSLMTGDIIAACTLITLGVVLGKTTAIQLVIMVIIETPLFVINEFVGLHILQAVDAGGSVYVHTFGAYYGLGVSFILGPNPEEDEEEEEDLETADYMNDVTAMIGTLFLWLFWPSFNAGLLSGDARYRAIINTYLSIVASCVMTFVTSSMFHPDTKYEMAHIQNATLAGGVCVGTAANMMVQPFGALLIGVYAGFISTLGFRFVQGFLLNRLRIHDTCGVHNLHGMPGVSAGLIGVIMAAMATVQTYGYKVYSVFPAISEGRSAGLQAGFQAAALCMTLAVAIVFGLLTGLVLKLFSAVDRRYDDEEHWEVPGRPLTREEE